MGTHFSGPVTSTAGFVGDLTGSQVGYGIFPTATDYATGSAEAIDPDVRNATVSKGSAGTYTVAAPGANYVGKFLLITSISAFAHVITITGLNTSTIVTLPAVVGASILLLAVSATKWVQLTTLNSDYVVGDITATIKFGDWPGSVTAPDTKGLHLGTGSRTRALVVAANDGKADPTRRIESSDFTFMQSVDWATAWSATALEGVFYGGYDLIATEDGANISGAGGWIYLDDESGYAGAGSAPAVGTSGLPIYVAGLESFVALPANVNIGAYGVICGLKLTAKFNGGSAGSGKRTAIAMEVNGGVEAFDYVYIANQMAGSGFVASVNAMTTNNTFAAMKVNIGGVDGFIPVFADEDWTAS